MLSLINTNKLDKLVTERKQFPPKLHASEQYKDSLYCKLAVNVLLDGEDFMFLG